MNYILNFVNSATDNEINAYLEANNLIVESTYDNLEKIYLVSSLGSTPPASGILEHILQDSNNPIELLSTVNFTQPTVVKTIDVEDDKNWWKAASFYDIDWANTNHSHYVMGRDVDVYILDSGIDINHPEFADVNVELLYSFNGSNEDVNGHGTAIASLIAGNTCGLTKANLKILKIFESGSPTLLSKLVEAFNIVLGNINYNRPAVVNLSWGISRNEFIDNLILRIINNNVIVVAAAGNNGTPIGNITPAAISEVMTIGSFNQNFEPSNFSNYTEPSALSLTHNATNYGVLDGWAPGEKIWVATPGGGYDYAAGTSLSAAIHTGAVAYDIDFSAMADGSRLECFVAQYMQLKNFQSLSRANILTLSQQYSQSVNKITTYAGKNSPFFPNKEWFNVTFAWISGNMVAQPFINQLTTKSVTISPDLPSQIQLMPSGQLMNVGLLTDSDPDYILTSHIAQIVFSNNDTKTINFEVAIRKESLDMGLIPEGYEWIQAYAAECAGNCNVRCPKFNPNFLPNICGPFNAKSDPGCEFCE